MAARSPLGRDVCPRSSHFGTDSGCPLSYEMPALSAALRISCRLGHRSRLSLCARSSHFGTDSGCPLSYEMPALSAALWMSCRLGHRSRLSLCARSSRNAQTVGVHCLQKCVARPPLSDSKCKKRRNRNFHCDCAFLKSGNLLSSRALDG